MTTKFQFTSVETVISKFARDLRGTDINELDIIDWTGEALGFMKVPELLEELVTFIEVKDHKAELPCGFQSVIQLAKNNKFNYDNLSNFSPAQVIPQISTTATLCDSGDCEPCNSEEIILQELDRLYLPIYTIQMESAYWLSSGYFRENFSAIRLASNKFFNYLANDVNPDGAKDVYTPMMDEYTIVGDYPNVGLLFSFAEGQVALAYLGAKVDPETGYPLIPDDSYFITAITYYIKWKMAERFRWNGREGMALEAKDAEEKWIKYCRGAINRAKMPHGIDDYQDILEQTQRLIPRFRTYYGYFGNMGREEDRRFNNPDGRRRFTFNRYTP